MLSHTSSVNTEQSATMNSDSSDSGDLTCLVLQNLRIESVRGGKLSRKLLQTILPEYFLEY